MTAEHGLFGAKGTGDTSGYGGLVRKSHNSDSAERPYGGYFDEMVDELERAYPEFKQQMATWMHEGRVRSHEQVTSGFENITQAFLGMLRGDNLGKTVVRIAHPAGP